LADNTFEKGLEIRTDVLGAEYVKKAAADAESFTKPFQDLVTEYCWGAVWGPVRS
jgi:4-carboxymuconolactone decarboxylase